MWGTVLEIISGVRDCMRRKQGPRIDTPQARLQSELTVFVLAAVSALPAAKQYLGDPIHCIFDSRSAIRHLFIISQFYPLLQVWCPG